MDNEDMTLKNDGGHDIIKQGLLVCLVKIVIHLMDTDKVKENVKLQEMSINSIWSLYQ